ncbi:coiled-coil domain-containing protein [Anaeramoeba ignava]|uniref:Coiled-coil domain-containing protein n=1 Tax=Anaeramoeba ignava TaxID=1746090 RepID=A0A9Q0LTS2_ANAIG|nr:coiled-coil domain-containing protein [Anaeramoeba ignava]
MEIKFQNKNQKLTDLSKQIKQEVENLNRIEKYLQKTEKQEKSHQKFISQLNSTLETESKLLQLAKSEKKAIENENKTKNKIQTEKKEFFSQLKLQTEKMSNQIQKLLGYLGFNQKDLDGWIEETKINEEELIIEAKISKEKNKEFANQNFQVKKLIEFLHQKKLNLQREEIERKSVLIDYQKTIKDLESIQKEITSLNSRIQTQIKEHERIQSQKQSLLETKRNAHQKIQNDQEVLSENQKEQNKIDQELEILQKNQETILHKFSKLRQELNQYEKELEKAKSQQQTLQNQVNNLSKEKQKNEKEISNLDSEIEKEKKRLEKQIEKNNLLKEEYRKASQVLSFSESKETELDGIVKIVQKSLKTVQKKYNKEQKMLENEHKEMNNILEEKEGNQNELIVMKETEKKLNKILDSSQDEEAQKQNLLYQQLTQINKLQNSVNKKIGQDKTEQEKIDLETRIEQSKRNLEKNQEKIKLIQEEKRRAEMEIRQNVSTIEKHNKEISNLETTINESSLHYTFLKRQINELNKQKNQLMIKENMEFIKNAKMEQILTFLHQKINGLENRKQQLEIATEEKMNEIFIHLNMLGAEKRTQDELKQSIIHDIIEKKQILSKLNKKLQVLHSSFLSQSEFFQFTQKTQNLPLFFQQKDQIQEEKLISQQNDVCLQISQLQKEIENFQKTLEKIIIENDSFLEETKKFGIGNDKIILEEKLAKELENKMEIFDEMKQKNNLTKKRLDEIKPEVKFKENEFKEIEESNQIFGDDLKNLQNELEDGKFKLERTKKRIYHFQNKFNNNHNYNYEIELKDFECSQLQNQVFKELSQLFDSTDSNIQKRRILIQELKENKIKIPYSILHRIRRKKNLNLFKKDEKLKIKKDEKLKMKKIELSFD